MRKILQYGSPILEKASINVEDINAPEIQKIINEMLKIMQVEAERSAGLSAPQIGELLNITVCRRTDLENSDLNTKPSEIEWEVMINPKITRKSTEKSTHWEGCLSVNDGDLFGRVQRPREVDVEYIDIAGKIKKVTARDFFSHVVQHEADHLKGVLFLKYIKDPTELYTSDELE
jgi:peptide deformylase